jgi:HEAT repeat protein
MAALESALRERDTVRARELIRSLGQLGSERAVPKLVALMERRSLLRRRPLRELKLAALGALARLPGREALRSLERASGSSDAEIRARATQLLARESGSGSEGVQSAPPHPAPESEPLH